MKVVMRKEMLNIVNPTPEQEESLKTLTSMVTVKPAVNGFTISGKPELLYIVLYSLSAVYDIEIV